jgi:molecular chaperone DnaJ
VTPDYYNVLGVSRNATSDDVKKAYRRMAMRWHPDRNPDDPAAIEHFKDIAAAYACLSDAEERARYDRLGPLYQPNGRPPRPEEVGEVLGSVWSNLFKRRKVPRGEDLRYTVTVTLEEVATGVEREIAVPRRVRCVSCDGDGARPEDGRKTCDACQGSGRGTGRFLQTSCYHCQGRGYLVVHPCGKCGGDGVIGSLDRIVVRIPAGVATGQKLKLATKGDEPAERGVTGDLYVVVAVAAHELFRRRGEDLVVTLPLTYPELVLGADVRVPTLDGTTTVRVAPGTAPGQVLRLAGRGLPRVGGASAPATNRGDLHLEVTLALPTALGPADREALASWGHQLAREAHPARAHYDRQLEERR